MGNIISKHQSSAAASEDEYSSITSEKEQINELISEKKIKELTEKQEGNNNEVISLEIFGKKLRNLITEFKDLKEALKPSPENEIKDSKELKKSKSNEINDSWKRKFENIIEECKSEKDFRVMLKDYLKNSECLEMIKEKNSELSPHTETEECVPIEGEIKKDIQKKKKKKNE